ncbi:MAG: hypothetical protein KAT68_00710 [Bacteroidales bacterium]|nr:hypothetical protein [Bacteroidales bacterium]
MIKHEIKGYDISLDIIKTIPQARALNVENSITEYDTFIPTSTIYTEGAVIDVRTSDYVTLYWQKSASDADNSCLRIITLETSGGTVDYREVFDGVITGGVISLSEVVYEIDKAVGVNKKTFNVVGLNYIRFDVAKATDVGTDSIFTTKISKRPTP